MPSSVSKHQYFLLWDFIVLLSAGGRVVSDDNNNAQGAGRPCIAHVICRLTCTSVFTPLVRHVMLMETRNKFELCTFRGRRIV